MTQPSLADACVDSWTPVYPCPLPVGSEAVSGTGLSMAINVLWSLSGRQFGLCTKLLRPCRRECYEDTWPAWWHYGGSSGGGDYGWPYPALIGGQWFNLACGSCGDNCSCSVVSEAVLPGPLYDVTQVKVDGTILTPQTDYRVDSSRLLVRLNGETWPICNNLNLDDDQVGTWSVTTRTGVPVPPLGQAALGILTIEFVKLLLCDASCQLPKPVQSISRQGVNVTFLDPNQLFGDGQIGLYVPDLFINTYNPNRIRKRSRVYNIDDPNRRLVNVPNVS